MAEGTAVAFELVDGVQNDVAKWFGQPSSAAKAHFPGANMARSRTHLLAVERACKML